VKKRSIPTPIDHIDTDRAATATHLATIPIDWAHRHQIHGPSSIDATESLLSS
jgi:hypothetical protein